MNSPPSHGGSRRVRLRDSDIHRPGITRIRCGRGFRYADPDGRPITDGPDGQRLRDLAIPPAWTDVWICPEANGHIQATGTDAAGRRRYLYHPRFREQQEAAKHEHILEVAPALPLLRKHTAEDLKVRGLCRDRVLACAARLLDLGFRRALRALLRRRDDGERLFAYWQAGAWHATALAAVALAVAQPVAAQSRTARRRAVTHAVREVTATPPRSPSRPPPNCGWTRPAHPGTPTSPGTRKSPRPKPSAGSPPR